MQDQTLLGRNRPFVSFLQSSRDLHSKCPWDSRMLRFVYCHEENGKLRSGRIRFPLAFCFLLSVRSCWVCAGTELYSEGSRVTTHLTRGLGFGVWGLGFGVWGLGFGVWGL